jgi:hypothetical protein
MTQVTQNDLVQVFTADYEPTGFVRNYMPAAPHHRPLFTTWAIEQMLQDSRINFGLELIKGPIHSFTKFFSQEESDNPSVHKMLIESDVRFPYMVNCDDEEVGKFILRNMRRFWQTGAIKALNAIEWGFSGSEVFYKKGIIEGKDALYFDNLKDLDPRDLACVTQRGGIIGFEIYPNKTSSEYIGIPKGFWHVHARERNRYYGQSRLFGAYGPWWEIWGEGGARDIRRNWYYRNAFDGGEMKYPIGYTQLPDGSKMSNRDLALEMLSKKRSGGFMIFPNQLLNDRPAWEYTPPVASIEPQGLQSYLATLSDEELEGLGIPPEVIQGGSSGLGSSSGREIPMIAYFSTLQKIVDFLIQDFSAQILDFLIPLNFSKLPFYEIVPVIPYRAYEEEMKKQMGEDKPKPSSSQESDSKDDKKDKPAPEPNDE